MCNTRAKCDQHYEVNFPTYCSNRASSSRGKWYKPRTSHTSQLLSALVWHPIRICSKQLHKWKVSGKYLQVFPFSKYQYHQSNPETNVETKIYPMVLSNLQYFLFFTRVSGMSMPNKMSLSHEAPSVAVRPLIGDFYRRRQARQRRVWMSLMLGCSIAQRLQALTVKITSQTWLLSYSTSSQDTS